VYTIRADMKRTTGAEMAASVKLTDAIADKAEGPPHDGKRPYLIHYDTATRGFGLRITKAGAKSWILNYRGQNGVERRLTIGTHRDPWREVAARKEALRLKAMVDQGRDPQGERNTIRAAPTVNDLIVRWREEHAPKLRPRNRQQNELLIGQWIKPELGTRKVADLRYADIEALHRKISTKGGRKKAGTPYRANRALALLSKMFTLAVRWEWRSDNPCRGVERNHEERRYRYLTPAELERLVKALSEYSDQTAANAIRLLLLTGARSGEVLTATWEQIDLDAGTWTKPSSHTKQKHEHRIPLSAPTRQLLAGIARTDDRVFPGLGQIRDDWAAICRKAGLEGVRVHDLRHTHASILASAGLSLPIIGSLLGHTQPGTTARYAHLFDDPLRAATEKVGTIVTAAAGGPAAREGPAGELLTFSRRRGRS
jgi:integrase